ARVGDGEGHEVGLLGRRGAPHLEANAATLREFDGIAQEIGEDLPQSQAVGEHVLRYVVGDVAAQRQALRVRDTREDLRHLIHDGAQSRRLAAYLELARLNLREIEDVVDE